MGRRAAKGGGKREKSGSWGAPVLGTPPPLSVQRLRPRSGGPAQLRGSWEGTGGRDRSEALPEGVCRTGKSGQSPTRSTGTWGRAMRGKGLGSALTSTRANRSSSSQGSGIGILPGGGSSETEGGSPGPPSALSRLPIAAGPPWGPQPPTSTPGGLGSAALSRLLRQSSLPQS